MAGSRLARTWLDPVARISASVAHAQSRRGEIADEIRLKDYRPRVLHKLPVTSVEKARHP
jgi:hypothetical protein